MLHRIHYLWGAKAFDLKADSHIYTHLDCSGFAQFIMYRSTDGKWQTPEGSWEIADWCQEQGFAPWEYEKARAVNDPNRLFIAFILPKEGHPGHVWFLRHDATYECCGSQGVTSRDSDLSFLRVADRCYELPCTPN